MSRVITKTNGNNIKQVITYSDVTLDNLGVSQYQKEGTLTAQIRQTVTTVATYPSKQVSTDKQQGLFGIEDFGFTGQDFTNTETRVAWIPVPVGISEEQVKEKLKAANATFATIYKSLSNQPILDKNQKYAVSVGLNGVTLDTFANSQVVRFPQGHAKEGQLCLDANNKVQYRRTFFWNTPLDDQDTRSTDPADVYLSPELAIELSTGTPASVPALDVNEGQTL